MKNRNWFWGIFFLLAAVFLIASQTGSFIQIGFISILATILLAALGIHSAANRNFFGVSLALVFLYVIYRQPLHLLEISLWMLIVAAILASIGLSIIFDVHAPRDHWHDGHEHFNQTTETVDDNNPYAKVSFNGSSKYLHSDCLKSGQYFVSFGALEVFFDQAQLSPEGAELFLDCSFGAIKLYIPKSWQVYDNVHVSLGAVENDTRFAQPEANAPRLSLNGNVSFGAIEIHYI